ncbi:transglutaminase-like domain-containing protein [Mucilaginibacter paludis]|uniref:Transglutaminase domain-containing protein n=1 Tax=Mucilaginibacter paludis DSM 18603 TaxID=714943 RepID=H1Y9V0_9SPHI|nr:transglutaminase family protein [Mucilaginibacter paludis]EHQ31133.1 transglutaminase domain-containing protein [Mucilaginibacter paludis DSM 18603]
MKFRVSGNLGYEVITPSTLILNIHALRSAAQSVLEESLIIEPYFKIEELTTLYSENRYVRLEITQPVNVNINYSALVDTSYKTTNRNLLSEVPIVQMDASVLPYLSPSRYCQSDKLYCFANNKFGKIDNAFEKVLSLTKWIYENVEYLSGSTNSQTSAYDTVTEQAGVCRDFAHLGIALCRALSIPARYFTGYSYQLNPPDFHACFEAFLGSEWVIFDATKLAPLNGLVKIATGRDAADTAIATIFGHVNCTFISASCELAEDKFKPFNYTDSKSSGLTYL